MDEKYYLTEGLLKLIQSDLRQWAHYAVCRVLNDLVNFDEALVLDDVTVSTPHSTARLLVAAAGGK